jgi:hypothetical protein
MAAEGPVFISDEQAPTAVQNERRGADRLLIDLVDDASTGWKTTRSIHCIRVSAGAPSGRKRRTARS